MVLLTFPVLLSLAAFVGVGWGSISEACSKDSIRNCIVKNDLNNNLDWPCVKYDAASDCLKAKEDGCDDEGKEFARELFDDYLETQRGTCQGLAEGDCVTNRISSCVGHTPWFQGLAECSSYDAPKVKECLTEHLKLCPKHEAIEFMIDFNDDWVKTCKGGTPPSWSNSEDCSNVSISNCIVKNDLNNNLDWPCIKYDAASDCLEAKYDGCDDEGKEFARELFNQYLNGTCQLAEGDCVNNRISSCAGHAPWFQGLMGTKTSFDQLTDCSMLDAPKVEKCLTEHLKLCPNDRLINFIISSNNYFWELACNGAKPSWRR